MKKFLINKNWRYIKNDKQLFLYNIITAKQLIIDSDIAEVSYLLEYAQKSFSTGNLEDAILTKFPNKDKEWLAKSIIQLRKYNIIKPVIAKPKSLTDKYLTGLDRQLDYLDEVFPKERQYSMQLRLKKSKVAILGLGNIGQYTLLPLIASGVGEFVCVDFDTVDERNIGRQPIFRTEDIGKYKADVIKEFIKKSRVGVKVKTFRKMLSSAEDVKKYIHDCDIVVHCCDYPRFLIHEWINEACLELKKPNLLDYSGRVGPLCIPYKSACYACLESLLRSNFSVYNEFKKVITDEGLGRYPELAVLASLTGSLAAREIIAFLLNLPTKTYNAFYDIDPKSLEIINHKLIRQGYCYACSNKRSHSNITA